jgi:hypothetical protein
MNYVVQSVASEDMIQLFEPAPATPGTPVVGVAYTEVTVKIRKNGASGFTEKTLVLADWTDRGGGNYSLQFSASDFDTLGAFRFQVIPNGGDPFVKYEDVLYVVEEIPVFPSDPPTINDQDDATPGITPDPVYQGSTLTINGADLGGASSVTIDGVSVPITSSTDAQLQVTVTSPDVEIGTGLNVVVETSGGTATSSVDVVLDPADIPGDGMVEIYGYIHSPGTGQPRSGISVYAYILDMPHIAMGVGWVDEKVSAVTDGNGKFSLDLPRNVRVELVIPKTRYRRVFDTPDQVTANYLTEIP